MKRLTAVILTGAILVATGCNNNSSKSGGPGATNREGVHITQQENSFSLSPPKLSSSVKQGEKQNVTIGISRGKGFDEDVVLSFGELPKGVTITPANPTIKHGDKDLTLALDAAKDAALGDHEIHITAKPSKGPEAKDSFKITVKKP